MQERRQGALLASEEGSRSYTVKARSLSCCNSVWERLARIKPQFRQTTSFGNARTDDLSRFAIPGKWIFISEFNSLKFVEPHKEQIKASIPIDFYAYFGG